MEAGWRCTDPAKEEVDLHRGKMARGRSYFIETYRGSG
jgi:hypothetical protein